MNKDKVISSLDALIETNNGEYGNGSFTVARLAMVLVATTAASLASVIGPSSASAAQVSAARAAQPSCYQFWRVSNHTERVRWYHCHPTSSAFTKRVHICGYSGILHGISVAKLDGTWLLARHRHDRGGEGCRRRA